MSFSVSGVFSEMDYSIMSPLFGDAVELNIYSALDDFKNDLHRSFFFVGYSA